MSDKAKQVLMVMGTHHSRMDYLASEFKERLGQVNCTGFIHPYGTGPDNQIHNEDLNLSDVGDALSMLYTFGLSTEIPSCQSNHIRACLVDTELRSVVSQEPNGLNEFRHTRMYLI